MQFIHEDFSFASLTPSRLYLYGLDEGLTLDPSAIKSAMNRVGNVPTECLCTAEGNDNFCRSLRLLQEMKKYPQITVCTLGIRDVDTIDNDEHYSSDESSDESTVSLKRFNPIRRLRKEIRDRKQNEMTNLFLKSTSVKKNIRYVKIYSCDIHPIIWKYFVTQFYNCNKLKEVNLSETRGVPSKVGRCISTMKSLKKLRMSSCFMPRDVSIAVLKGLSNCHNLVEFNLDENVLTGELQYFFGSTDHPRFHFLEDLSIDDTTLNGHDVKCLFSALGDGKLPKLNDLSCDLDAMGKDGLRVLLDAACHPVLPDWLLWGSPATVSSLIEWYLYEVRSQSRADTDIVLDAVSGNLPDLKSLNLSQTNKGLRPWRTTLKKDDVRSLTESVGRGNLQDLGELKLDWNALNRMKNEVENLIRTCVSFYKDKELLVSLDNNKLSAEFQERINSSTHDTCTKVSMDV